MKRLDVQRDRGPSDPARPVTAEARFAARVARVLDESADGLPPATLARLVLARKAALRAQSMPIPRRAPERQAVFAGAGGSSRQGFARAGFVFSAIVLVGACLAGLYQFEQDRRIEDLADVDSAVLNDDLPISAYTDQGFNAFLKQNP